MGVYLRAKFEVSNKIPTSFSKGGGEFYPLPSSKRTPKKPTQIRARTRSGMYPGLVIKTPEQRHSRPSSVFVVNFEHMWHLVLAFPFLTWNK